VNFRKNDWLDTTTKKIYFGIDVKYNGEWCHLKATEEPFFETEVERDVELK
jgi:hypothetical protein